MAINKNHEFEDLDGVKCAIVEKNVSKERADFLKQLLEFNKYTVVVVAAAPPKPAPAPTPKPAAAKPAAAAATAENAAATPAATTADTSTTTAKAADNTAATAQAAASTAAATNTTPGTVEPPAVEPPAVEPPPPPSLFTVGVTDVTFNPTNAIFGRLLKTPGGRIVTLAYWQQKEAISNDELPYFAKK